MNTKKLRWLTLGLAFCLCFILSGFSSAAADSRPYFRGYGADFFVGGGFNSGPASCNPSASSYQAPNYNPAANLYKGAIMGYAQYKGGPNNSVGAGSQFGALALGLIEGNNGPGEPYGFSTGSSGYKNLSFANQSTISATNFWGGFLEGTTRQTHCIPDYFGTKQSSPQTISGVNDVGAMTSKQYLVDNPAGILEVKSPTEIPKDAAVTVFVNGNVYISGDIRYAPRSTYTADTSPKFALVVKGNIYIAPGVGRLDGLYIAQPSTDPDTSGFIWTCHGNNDDTPTDTFVSSSCRSKLTINGAMIAKKVNLLRIQPNPNGGVATATANEGIDSANIAEVFNFTPEMITGGGFFNQPGSASGQIQSLVTLPPIF